jgi:hypothetical protein
MTRIFGFVVSCADASGANPVNVRMIAQTQEILMKRNVSLSNHS